MKKKIYNKLNNYWILFLVFSFLFCIIILVWHHYPTGSLGFPKYNDHMRHLRFSYEFLSRGVHIYDTFMFQFAHIGNEFMYEWPNIIYLYPLGCVLFFLPFSIIAFTGLLSFAKVANLIILVLLGFAHINSALLQRLLFRFSSERFLRGIFLVFFYLMSTWWAFHGQYESIVIFFLLLSLYAQKTTNQFLLFTTAFFLKLQTLFLLPVFGYFLWLGYKKKLLLTTQYVISYLMIGMNIIMMFMVRNQLIPRITNPIHFTKLLTTPSYLNILVVLLAATLIAYCIIKKRWQLLYLTITPIILLMTVGELQGWYATILFVTPLFLSSEKDQAVYITWFLAFLWIMNLLPFLPGMIEVVFKGLI